VVTDEARADRDTVMDALMNQGIATRVGVMAAHREKALAEFATPYLPVTEAITDQSVILPLFHTMTPEDQHTVARSLTSVLA
jgi:perosamine synthetase